jgi:hypothetical protein
LGQAVGIGNFTHIWLYLYCQLLGALLAVVVAIILRGPGGLDLDAQLAAQGKID